MQNHRNFCKTTCRLRRFVAVWEVKLITFTNTKCDNVKLHNKTNIVSAIKCSRLRWAGHVVRMDKNELPKKIVDKPWKSTKTSRPKSRWIDGVEDRRKELGCRIWLAFAHDRGRWRHFLEETKNHPGL